MLTNNFPDASSPVRIESQTAIRATPQSATGADGNWTHLLDTKQPVVESTEPTRISAAEQGENGWLIAQLHLDGSRTGRFLQIATGQWAAARYATYFPEQSNAILYAHENGFVMGQHVSVVPVKKQVPRR